MQELAAEMNLSETAFVAPRQDGFGLRWFTPRVEVDLCGHATLAAAHVLWETGRLAPDQLARFHTRSGLLTARNRGESIEMEFPATPAEPAKTPQGLMEALGCAPLWVGKSAFDYLVQVDSEEFVRTLQPDLAALSRLPVRGVIVTARGSGEYDFVSRFFAPASGIDEDPVTGSAHCCLGPFWKDRLKTDRFSAFQASARGGEIGVSVHGDRVHLSGKAVTIFRAELSDAAGPGARPTVP